VNQVSSDAPYPLNCCEEILPNVGKGDAGAFLAPESLNAALLLDRCLGRLIIKHGPISRHTGLIT